MTALAQRDTVAEVCTTIASEEMGQKIAQALPPGVSLDRFTRTTLTAVQQNPEVVTADRSSLYNSVIRCAQDGLLPDGRQAALVIFKVKGEKVVQYLPMIGGLRLIAADRGLSLEAYVVYENDVFEWQLGYEPSVIHKPPRLNEERGEPIGAYAVATDQHGQKYLEVMSRQEIEDVRKVSRAATSEYGPWVNWWGEMARKTVARRLFKQLPLGALNEKEERIVRSSDSDSEFSDGRMTVDEANAVAPLSNLKPPVDSGPDDVVEDGVVDYSGYVVDGTVYTGKTLADVYADANGLTWLKTKLKSLPPDSPLRVPVEGFVEAELPDVWEAYCEWKASQ